jgi:hypothetical protein
MLIKLTYVFHAQNPSCEEKTGTRECIRKRADSAVYQNMKSLFEENNLCVQSCLFCSPGVTLFFCGVPLFINNSVYASTDFKIHTFFLWRVRIAHSEYQLGCGLDDWG